MPTSDDHCHYFAFGSNLSTPRLLARIPGARHHGIAILPAHRLCWHKNDRGRSAKCDIVAAGTLGQRVYGVVYRMTQADRLDLDRYEGAGYGYTRRELTVYLAGSERIDVFTYQAIDIDRRQRPYSWYKEHVLRGALEHGFPRDYVAAIRNTPSIEDADRERHGRELAIYGDPPIDRARAPIPR